MKKKQVLLIFGGRSAEHEVSVLSARNVAAALDRKKYDLSLVGISHEGTWFHVPDPVFLATARSLHDRDLLGKLPLCALISKGGAPELVDLESKKSISVDVAFPILHGSYGEDGTIQGLFRMANLPFVGCDVFACSAGMDKEVMKRLLTQAQIPTAKYVCMTSPDRPTYNELVAQLGTPFFIKPASQGSSVGVHKVKSEKDFKTQLADAFSYDHKVLAEEFIEGREIECAVLGSNAEPKASVCGEVIPQHEFYSYEAKYIDENGAKLKIPADLPKAVHENVQRLAEKTFHVMGCEGLTRVDFFLKKSGHPVVNEINTIPGFTKISMYPKMWQASGLEYTDLISKLLDLGLESFAHRNSLKTNFPGAV